MTVAEKFIGDSILVKTHIADAALEANRFVKLVTATGPQPHVVYAGAGEAACGVTRERYNSGDVASIVLIGTAYVTASVNVAAGQAIAADVNGQAAVAAAAGQVLGQAMTDANAGEAVLVLLAPGGIF